MRADNKNGTSNIIRNIARYGLLALSVLLFGFALISGSGDYGGGLKGILKNSPNALPWISLTILIVIAWKRELIGGILTIILGLWLVFYFNFSGPNFWWSTFVMTALVPLLGSFFIVSWYLRQQSK